MSTTDLDFVSVATSPRAKGEGLNSVPVRFGLIALSLGTLCGIGQALIWHGDTDRQTPVWGVVVIFTLIVRPGGGDVFCGVEADAEYQGAT
jgi:hypothetical protein